MSVELADRWPAGRGGPPGALGFGYLVLVPTGMGTLLGMAGVVESALGL